MKENLIGKGRSYNDSGDFSHRYFYLLRSCVPPPAKIQIDGKIQPIARTEFKTERQLAMDKARKKFNSRNKKER